MHPVSKKPGLGFTLRSAWSPGALAWNADQLSSGSRDRMILQRDIRTPPLQSERRLQGHRQEVCGLKWSTDHQLLASGGNDNKVDALGPSLSWPPDYSTCLAGPYP